MKVFVPEEDGAVKQKWDPEDSVLPQNQPKLVTLVVLFIWIVTGSTGRGGLLLMVLPTSNPAFTGGLCLLAEWDSQKLNGSWHYNRDIHWLSTDEDAPLV